VGLEKVTGQVDGNKPCTAPHSREVEALDVASEFVLVDHHGGQRRCWRKEAAVHYENVYVLWLQPRFPEQRLHGREYHELSFTSGCFHGGFGRDVMDGRGKTCFFSKARPFQNPHLELHAFGVVLEDEPGVFHEGGKRDTARDWGLEAGVVHKEDRAWLGHEVDGEDHDDEEGGADDLNRVKVKRVPKFVELIWAQVK